MNAPTAAEIAGWPVTVDVPTAGRCYHLGRDAAYQAARMGELPGVVKVGRRLVVITAQLRAALGIDDQANAHPRALEEPHKPQIGRDAEEAIRA